MYKPHTIEQYKIQRFLDDVFAMEHFLVAPLSRTSLMLEDKSGEQIAFSFCDNEVREVPLPPAADPEDVKKFILSYTCTLSRHYLLVADPPKSFDLPTGLGPSR